MLHFGRDEGVEMVVAYHGVISTVRLQGKCAWDFLGEFFKNIFNDLCISSNYGSVISIISF